MFNIPADMAMENAAMEAAPLVYKDENIRRILRDVTTIAAVGLSANEMRPSYFSAIYMKAKGYRILPVNPRYAGQTLFEETVAPALDALTETPDMVQIFRKSKDVPPIVAEAIRIGAKVVWMQLGVRHDAAAALAETAGLDVIMDRSPKIEYGRLFGEIGWIGVNKGTISARKGQARQLKTLKGGLRKGPR